MTEYITDAVICNFDGEPGELIKHASVDITVKEEIVRCMDCKLFDSHYLKCFRPVLYFDHDCNPHWTDKTNFTAVTDATPYGFCAWGERREP